MPRFESLPEDLKAVPLKVGQIRLTNADIEIEILEISGGMTTVLTLTPGTGTGKWQSAQSYIQRSTKFLRMKGAPV